MPAPTRHRLVAHLIHTGIAGQVDTPRQNNLRHYRLLADGDPYHAFGLTFARRWTYSQVLALMAKRCGVVADPAYRQGIDTIDPDRTVDALEGVAERIAHAAAARERVLFATGHPDTLLDMYAAWCAALARRDVPVLVAAAGHHFRVDDGRGPVSRVLAWDRDVGFESDGRVPRHSHHPDGMRAILADLEAAGRPWPDLVVADHGFAGAAAEAGIDVVGFADCNDPALFAAEAEGKVRVTVPLDDGYPPEAYEPLVRYVLGHAGLDT